MAIGIEDGEAAPPSLIDHIRSQRLRPVQVIAQRDCCQGAVHAQIATAQLLYRIVIPPTHKHPYILIQQRICYHRPPPYQLGVSHDLCHDSHQPTNQPSIQARLCLEIPCRLRSVRCNRACCRKGPHRSQKQERLEATRTHPGAEPRAPSLASWTARPPPCVYDSPPSER